MKKALWPIILAFGAVSFGHQQPFPQSGQPEWKTPPSADETGHLIFNSVSSWLQHWPNTRWRNGHSIVLGYIAPGTLLYHGTRDPEIPARPNWVSFDFEHSYLFGTEMQTFAVEGPGRGLRVVYLDGSSASNMRSGTMDTQELIIRGELQPTKWRNEGDNIRGMCEWGKQYGIRGIIRMEFDFEVMICDFSDGLERISVTNVLPRYYPPRPNDTLSNILATHPRFNPPENPGKTPWRQPTDPPNGSAPPRGWKGVLRAVDNVVFEALQAGIWHDYAPGVPGVELDYSAAVSFFDPKYASLVDARRRIGKKESYRAGNVSRVDMEVVMQDLDEALGRDPSIRSGVRWQDIIRSVKERYSDRIGFLSHLLRKDESALRNATEAVAQVRHQVLVMLSPDLENKPIDVLDDWLAAPLAQCASKFTASIREEWLTPHELLLKRSVETVLREVCRMLGMLWEEVFDVEGKDPLELVVLLRRWKERVKNLQDWLGWSEWITCDPACGPTEVCSLPQWPIDMGRWDEVPDECEDLYVPKCMDRVTSTIEPSECKLKNLPGRPRIPHPQ